MIHETALIEPDVKIGENTKIWHYAHLRKNSQVGSDCIIARGVFIDAGVIIGDSVKIQNYVSIYHGVTIGSGVFIGPHVVFTNDKQPRAVNPDMKPKSPTDWIVTETHIMNGVSIGANATIVCGIEIGAWAMIGAGSVVTKDVPSHGLVVGNPAKLIDFVDFDGMRLHLNLSLHAGEFIDKSGKVVKLSW